MTAHPELFVSLDKLPGFDPVGLRVTATDDSGHRVWAMVVGTPESMLRVVSLGRKPTVYSTPPSGWCVDLADSATRDRVARWCAGRVGRPALGGALWRPCVKVGGVSSWRLRDDSAYDTFGPNGWHVVPIPLDSDADMRLPDGSRWVDAAALALVAVHLGQQVTP